MNGIHSSLAITVCKDASEAIQQGYVYRGPAYKPIRIMQVVVVQKGTVEGKATVDFILEDESGQMYVCLLTKSLLEMIPE